MEVRGRKGFLVEKNEIAKSEEKGGLGTGEFEVKVSY
jgi:hypothetical protein